MEFPGGEVVLLRLVEDVSFGLRVIVFVLVVPVFMPVFCVLPPAFALDDLLHFTYSTVLFFIPLFVVKV